MRLLSRQAVFCGTASALLLAGCANPGPPKPPSLQIPAAVTDLRAERHGNTVELRFTLPVRTADGITLPAGQIAARVCRAVESGSCKVLPGVAGSFTVAAASKTPSVLQNELANDLVIGAPRLLTYRLELFGSTGKSAGYSNPAFAVGGRAPNVVEGLRAEGSRLGVVLHWQRAEPAAEVLLVREDLKALSGNGPTTQATGTKAPSGKLDLNGIRKEKSLPAVVTLSTNFERTVDVTKIEAVGATLDTTAMAGEPYRYTAERKQTVSLQGHMLEMWSVASAPVVFTLHDNFPPPVPASLSVVGFREPAAPGKAAAFGVDLIWEPVQDDQLAGYLVYRAELPAAAGIHGARLTTEPIAMPGFHDATANGSKHYRYSVTSVDKMGNESDAATAVLEPQVF